MQSVPHMLTTITNLDLASVFGGCPKGQQQQQIVQAPAPQIINYMPAPQQQQQIVQAAPPQMPMSLPQRPSVSVAVDQTTTGYA